jgi:outer membrane lipoprotein carrier protein
MKFKTLFFVIFCLGFSMQSAAQSSAVENLKIKLAKLSTFEAKFNQTVTHKTDALLQESTGVLKLMQPKQLYWEAFEPSENVLIADGQTLWHVDPFVEQVIARDQQQAVANNPIVLLSNPASEFWQEFTISQSEQRFTIVANDPDAQIDKLVLVFSGDILSSLQLHDRQQQISNLVFIDIKQNQPLESTNFVFTLPEGFDLDDQRAQ